VSAPPKNIPYVNLQLDGNDLVACIDGDYDEALKLAVGDIVEFERYGKDKKFAKNLMLVDLASAESPFDDEPVAVPPTYTIDGAYLDNVINRATEIYLHETRQHAEFDPIRLTAIAVDMVGIYKETVKHL
jgi:hypothetical protein